MWLFISQCIYFVLAATPSQMGQNCSSSWDVTPHFTAACVACLIAMETFPEGFPWRGREREKRGTERRGCFGSAPPRTPSPTPSARDGAEPAVCYGVSPPSVDRTPPVCFDKAPRCPAGRSLAGAGEEGGGVGRGGGSEM